MNNSSADHTLYIPTYIDLTCCSLYTLYMYVYLHLLDLRLHLWLPDGCLPDVVKWEGHHSQCVVTVKWEGHHSQCVITVKWEGHHSQCVITVKWEGHHSQCVITVKWEGHHSQCVITGQRGMFTRAHAMILMYVYTHM